MNYEDRTDLLPPEAVLPRWLIDQLASTLPPVADLPLQPGLSREAATAIEEFVEVESGRNDQRAELAKAMIASKKAGASLLIARLDRFSRRVSFIATMMEISNEVTDPEAMMITPDMMDTIDYPQSDLIIEIMNDDGEGIPEQKLLHNQGGFTKGQLLYQLAQVLPEVDYGDHHFFEGLRRYSEDAIYEVLLGS